MLDRIKLIWAKGLKKILNPPAMRRCHIDKTARVSQRCDLTDVNIDRYSYVGGNTSMINVDVGAFCSIASRSSIGGSEHSYQYVSTSPVFNVGKNIMGVNFASFPHPEGRKTVIENDVWIGTSCVIKAGVKIGTGSIIGMGSVVTHDIPPYEIWAGAPAKKIRDRFEKNVSQRLLESEWWKMSDEELRNVAALFNDPVKFLEEVENRE